MFYSMAIALILTICIELLVAMLFFGVYDWYDIFVVIMAQVITNPLLNLIMSHIAGSFASYYLVLFFLELCVVVVEGLIYRRFLWRIVDRWWLMSFVCNLCSYLAGVILFGF